jgi:GNAT superfamily N-acetyltransferase
MNGYHLALRGEVLWERDELAAELLSPVNDPVTSDRYVEADGEPVAALHTNLAPPYSLARLYLAAPFTPGRLDYCRTLLNSGLRMLRSRSEIAADAVEQLVIPAEDAELMELVTELGFKPVRRVFTLEASTADIPEPRWPDDVQVSTLDLESDSDIEDAYEAFDAAFPPGSGGWRMEHDEFVHLLRRDPTALPGLSLVVRDAFGPIGLATNFRDTTRRLTGNIVHIGVAPRAQGRGIGLALLHESFRRFHARGWQHVRLATFVERDPGSPDLFDKVGMYPLFYSEVFVRPIF